MVVNAILWSMKRILMKVNCLCQHFLAYVIYGRTVWCDLMWFTWKRKCQRGSVKCEWSPVEINKDFLLIYSRMLFFIEQNTYFSHIPLRLQHYILHRDDEGQIVKQPDFTEGPTETPALLLALADVVMNANQRHAIWLSSPFLLLLFFPLIVSWGWVISRSSRRNHAAYI